MGRYEFTIFNFTSKTLYIARYFTPDGFVDINNITIEGVPLNLSKLDRYRYEIINGSGIEFYAVNVSTNLTKLQGVATYEVRYKKNWKLFYSLGENITIGTDFSFWDLASNSGGYRIVVTPKLPKGTLYVISGYGTVENGSTVVYGVDSGVQHLSISTVMVWMPNLERVDFTLGSMNFTVYLPSWVISDEGIEALKSKLNLALSVYGNLTGIEKPTERLFIIFHSQFWKFSQETLGYTARGINYFSTIILPFRNDLPTTLDYYQLNLFHEFAHEWFGHYAGFGLFVETPTQFLMLEAYSRSVSQTYFYDQYLDEVEKQVVSIKNFTYIETITGKYDNFSDPRLYSQEAWYIRYFKGPYILRSLRFLVGDQKFGEIFHTLLEECHGSYCEYRDFIRISEKVYGDDLSWFFDEWFNTTEVPDYNVTVLNITQVENTYNLTLTITDASNFTMPVPVRIYLENGEYVDERVWVNGTATVSLELPDKPVKIVIDPEEAIANVNREFSVNGVVVKVD
ncbi:MAG: hypothetical protein PWQ79_1797 [Thermococcaceae archaeon]|nr:hypothetical protein [Thermococcaceae archaeon]MDK2914882.1 hypothetical protein [Thermococcaceae archaeon]